MKKNILIYIPIILLLISGCSNVKYIGKRLNKEERVINNNYIQYLYDSFPNTTINFKGRLQGHKNCVCTERFLDASCFNYKCEIVKNKYIWKYRICSNNTDLFCTDAKYDDVASTWYIDREKDLKLANAVLDILNNNKIKYSTFIGYGGSGYIVVIKKEKNTNNLTSVIEDIFEQYNHIQTQGDHTEIVLFNSEDYDYIINNIDNPRDVLYSRDFYRVFSEYSGFVSNIDYKNVSNDFICDSPEYLHISYVLSYKSDESFGIRCRGIKKDNNSN